MHRLPLASLVVIASFVTAPLLPAQRVPSGQHDGMSGPPPGPPPEGGPGGPGGPGMGDGPHNPAAHILPPGLWWRQTEVVQAIGLNPDQQKRMDGIFQDNRIQLVHLKASLEEEEIRLEPMLAANPPDSGRALSEIGKIADLRAELEKTDARMLLGLRGVLTAEQWTKLQAYEQAHRPRFGDRGFGPDHGMGHGSTGSGMRGSHSSGSSRLKGGLPDALANSPVQA